MTKWKEDEFLFYSNVLNNNYAMKNLTAAEMNILFALLAKISRNTGKVTEPLENDLTMELNLEEIGGKASVSRLQGRANETLRTIWNVQNSLVTASGSFLNGSKVISAPLFTKLATDTDNGIMEVVLNKEVVNEYLKVDTAEGGKGEFTIINLLKFTNLKKKASKALYCLLSQYQGFGLVKMTVENLKKALFVPEKTINSRFFERYLDVAMEELEASGLFTNMKMSKISKKGSKAITSIQITFKKVGAKQLIHDMLEEKAALQAAQKAVEVVKQPTVQVEEPKEPQKAPLTTLEASDSTPYYALDMFGMPITEAEYVELESYLQEQCELLEGA